MQKTVLSERMFEFLTNHVAQIEGKKESIIKSFYADNAETGMDSEIFFREYTAGIEDYLKSVRVKKDAADCCPISIIGSTVDVRDAEDMEIESYQIVLPFENQDLLDMSQASCFSPMGRALLLKQVGDKVSIKTPGGQIEYEIMNITISDEITCGNDENSSAGLFESKTSMAF